MYNDRASSQPCILVAKEARSLHCVYHEEAGLISWECPQMEKGLVKILPMLPTGNVYRRSLLKFKILETKDLDYLLGPWPLEGTMPRLQGSQHPMRHGRGACWEQGPHRHASSHGEWKEPRQAYMGLVFLIGPHPAKRTRPSWEMQGKPKNRLSLVCWGT